MLAACLHVKKAILLSLLVLLSIPGRAGEALDEALVKAVGGGRVDEARVLLEKGANPNTTTKVTWTVQSFWKTQQTADTPLLVLASSKGNIELVRVLLDHGADVNAANPLGISAIVAADLGAMSMWHSGLGQATSVIRYVNGAPMTEFLLMRGADPCLKDSEGRSALHSSLGSFQLKKLELLIAKGCDVNLQGKNGDSPLMTAVTADARGAARLLLASGADVKLKNKKGRTAQDMAEKGSYLEAVLKRVASGESQQVPVVKRPYVPVSADRSAIVFYRVYDFPGKPSAIIDREEMVRLQSGHFAAFDVAAGEHWIDVDTPGTRSPGLLAGTGHTPRLVNAQAGRVHYCRVSDLAMEWVLEVPEDEALFEMARLKASDATNIKAPSRLLSPTP